MFLESKHRHILCGQLPDLLIQKETKNQLSVCDKMQILYRF